MAVFVEDHFTRASDAALSAHTPDTVGTSWVEEINTSGQTVNVLASSDNLDLTGTQAAVQIVFTPRPAPASADYSVELTTVSVPSDSDDPHGPVVRYNAGDMYFAAIYRASNSNDKRLYKVVSGVRSLIAQSDSGLADGDKVRLAANGTALDVDEHTGVDWVNVISTFDSAIAGAGFAGLGWGNIGEATNDVNNITKIDDFIAQTLAAGGVTAKSEAGVKTSASGRKGVPGSAASAVAAAARAVGRKSAAAHGAAATAATAAAAGVKGGLSASRSAAAERVLGRGFKGARAAAVSRAGVSVTGFGTSAVSRFGQSRVTAGIRVAASGTAGRRQRGIARAGASAAAFGGKAGVGQSLAVANDVSATAGRATRRGSAGSRAAARVAAVGVTARFGVSVIVAQPMMTVAFFAGQPTVLRDVVDLDGLHQIVAALDGLHDPVLDIEFRVAAA